MNAYRFRCLSVQQTRGVIVMKKRSVGAEIGFWLVAAIACAILISVILSYCSAANLSDVCTVFMTCGICFFGLCCAGAYRYLRGKRLKALLLLLCSLPVCAGAGFGLGCLIYARELPAIQAQMAAEAHRQDERTFVQRLYADAALTQSAEALRIRRPFAVATAGSANEPWSVWESTPTARHAEELAEPSACRTLILLQADTKRRTAAPGGYEWVGGQNRQRAEFFPLTATILDVEAGVRYAAVDFSRCLMNYLQNGKLSGATLYSEQNGWQQGDFDRLLETYWVKE